MNTMYEFFRLTFSNTIDILMILWFVPVIWFVPMLVVYSKMRSTIVFHNWLEVHTFVKTTTIQDIDAITPNAFMITLPRWILSLIVWGILNTIVGGCIAIYTLP